MMMYRLRLLRMRIKEACKGVLGVKGREKEQPCLPPVKIHLSASPILPGSISFTDMRKATKWYIEQGKVEYLPGSPAQLVRRKVENEKAENTVR